MFGRGRRGCGVESAGLEPEIVAHKLSARLEQRISRLLQIIAVEGIFVVVPHMRSEPGTIDGGKIPGHVLALGGSGETEDIGRDVGSPSTGVVHGLCRALSGLIDRAEIDIERLEALGQVGRAYGPVVHLNVDIVVVVTVPRTLDATVPHTLKVHGHGFTSRRLDDEVAGKLIVEHLEPGIGLAFAIAVYALVGGDVDAALLVGRLAQVDAHAVEELGIVVDMAAQQLTPLLVGGALHAE